ncbi:magnesium-translocating P-type ATPase [Streptosporangium jomthongense]|uniref:Magnesium-transporting ATPase, P-type 1 n=1 Tax=Streptosporangium jomthongense TaxID=1193683 RepID=A0ABV8F7H7_9ACTN
MTSTIGAEGLSSEQAERLLAANGPNRVAAGQGHRGLRLLAAQFTSPIVLILIAATVLSMVLGDLADGLIIMVIVAASGALGFWQERSAGNAVQALLHQIRLHTEVIRDGREQSVPTEEIVAGDLVVLRAGDIVPADCTVRDSHSLLVNEAALTGESFPADKTDGATLYAGTHVASGSGLAHVERTGRDTELAAVSARLTDRQVATGFERGMTAFGMLLVRAMTVLVTAIFIVNLVLHRPFVESLLFSLALAVGLTPQLLPAIVAVSLSAGARRMAAEKVIVKRLDAIEDFGAMSVLCTDKTGTLTVGVVGLDAALDLQGAPSARVLALARLNAGLQHGFVNPLDQAIMAGAPPLDAGGRLDEVPYDFQRKRLSVLAEHTGVPTLVTKGALESVLQVCATARVGDRVVALETVRGQVEQRFAELSAAGFRVLGVCTAELPGRSAVTADDERDMTLAGLLAFHDPVKPGAAEAVGDLAALGVSVRLITGDNRLAAGQIARQVGLDGPVLTAADIDPLTDRQLAERVTNVQVFAEVDPRRKQRLVTALRASGATVAFLGDGINDAPALHTADIGISVDTAVDVAKQSAAIVLLDKDLKVIADGIRLGRRTLVNTLKYIRVTVSANFGNMLSMAAAAVFLPFLPLLPRQILLLNFLSDIPGTTIATDTVDPEQLRRPHSWDVARIRTFMIIFGLLSSVFDIATFLILRAGLNAGTDLFRTGWFVESTATELAVMLVLRTARPFFRSRPSPALLSTSLLVAALTVALPYTPAAAVLGLVPLPWSVLAVLAALTAVYVTANEMTKRLFHRVMTV